MSQAEHVLRMLGQIATGLRDKELEYSAAITQSCTFIANPGERDTAKAAIDILYEIQRVSHAWQGFIERLSLDAQQPGSPASQLLPESAKLIDATYADAPLAELLAEIESFYQAHIEGLPEAVPEPAPSDQISIRDVARGDVITLTEGQLFERLNITPEEAADPEFSLEQAVEDRGWEVLAEEDFEAAAARADRTT